MSKTIYISENAKLLKALKLLEESKNLFRDRRKLGKQSEEEFSIESKIADFQKELKS